MRNKTIKALRESAGQVILLYADQYSATADESERTVWENFIQASTDFGNELCEERIKKQWNKAHKKTVKTGHALSHAYLSLAASGCNAKY